MLHRYSKTSHWEQEVSDLPFHKMFVKFSTRPVNHLFVFYFSSLSHAQELLDTSVKEEIYRCDPYYEKN